MLRLLILWRSMQRPKTLSRGHPCTHLHRRAGCPDGVAVGVYVHVHAGLLCDDAQTEKDLGHGGAVEAAGFGH